VLYFYGFSLIKDRADEDYGSDLSYPRGQGCKRQELPDANFGALFARQGINTVKAIYLRRVKQILKHYAFNNVVKELSREPEAGLVRSPLDIVDLIMTEDPDRGKLLEKELRKLAFKLVLNQYRNLV
jgi:hypothetical protein